MNLLYLTGVRVYGPHLAEVNNAFRAWTVARNPSVRLGGLGFDGQPLARPVHLPDYLAALAAQGYRPDAVFLSDPWHNFWDPCADYPNCPSLYSGIDDIADMGAGLIVESGDSQFYYAETLRHLAVNPRSAVCIRALSHRWRFCKHGDDRAMVGAEQPSTLGGVVRKDAKEACAEHRAAGLACDDLTCRLIRRPILYLPHGAYPEMAAVSQGVAKEVDVLFSGSDMPDSYPARGRIATALRSARAAGLTVDWLPHPSDAPPGVIGPDFWRRVARARLAVAGTNAYGNLTMRYLEIPACGTLAIGDVPVGEGDAEPGWREHMVVVEPDDGPDVITDKIRAAVADPALPERTARARDFVYRHHSFAREATRVLDEVRALVAGWQK